jgi:hypothetical protein
MNREVLVMSPDLPAREARDLLREYDVAAAPVADKGGRPLGLLSLRSVIDGSGTAGDRMTRPALCVDLSTDVQDAARLLARSDKPHRLVVVDAGGALVGVVSPLDLLRALTGVPVRHPATFPHWDDATQISWTDDWPLEQATIPQAPDAPGVLALVSGSVGRRGRVVCVEPCENVRDRVRRLLALVAGEEPALDEALAARGLAFRAAQASGDAAGRIVALLRDQLSHVPPAGAT